MKKKQSKQLTKIPRQWKIIGIASLAVNALGAFILVICLILNSLGALDYVIVNTGVEKLCSEEFRNMAELNMTDSGKSINDQAAVLAGIDYPCSANGADTYYDQGFKDYMHSLGIDIEG